MILSLQFIMLWLILHDDMIILLVMLKRYSSTKNPKRKKIILVIAILLVIVLVVTGTYLWTQRKPSTLTTSDGEVVELTPATSEEKAESDQRKQDIVASQEATQSQASPNNPSQVTIVSANKTGVSAYVNGVFEDDGTCTATAVQGASRIIATSTGFQNVSYTQCAPLQWPQPLSNGTWVITVTYTSPTANATLSKNIEVN